MKRQGDLVFKKVNDQPKQVESKRLLIAEGEATTRLTSESRGV